MAGKLESLLIRIRDGLFDDDEVAQARALVMHDGRLPLEIREEALTASDDLAADTEALLALLGNEDGFGDLLRDAVNHQANVADDVMTALGAFNVPVAQAVREEAGDVEISVAALHALEADVLPVAEAVGAEAGTVDITQAVMAQIGFSDWLPIGAAIRDEAGQVDIAAAVMSTLGVQGVALGEAILAEAGTIDIADTVMIDLRGPMAMPSPTAVPELPAAANRSGWSVGALLMAAMAILVVGAGGVMNGLPGSSTAGSSIMAKGGDDVLQPSDMVFASAADVVVEDLSYGSDVVVFQTEGDAGALILWVDEEVVL
ncbi:MAG: hypothetical protein GWP91_26040 [Rhodobacterales bacterium]|nr:hypothetical protein [Rhodobacterales bacterium]